MFTILPDSYNNIHCIDISLNLVPRTYTSIPVTKLDWWPRTKAKSPSMKTNHETCTYGGNSQHTDTDTSVILVKVGHCGASMSEYIQNSHAHGLCDHMYHQSILSQYQAIHNSKSTHIHCKHSTGSVSHI